MALTLSKLDAQMAQVGRALATQRRQHQDMLQAARELLHDHAHQADLLAASARWAADRQKWRAAIPATSPLDAREPLPAPPGAITLVATDGSPVAPDRHGPALYYLLNVGSLIYRPGSGERPEADSVPTLFYKEEDLYEGDRLIQGDLLDTRLAAAEMAKLAELACAERRDGSYTLALGDGTLLLWPSADEPAQQRARKVREYLGHMQRIRQAGAALGAFSSRPRHPDVLRLLYLASLGRDMEEGDRAKYPFGRLSDRELFGFLGPGERSATYISPAAVNQDYGEHDPLLQVRFFYLNVGDKDVPEIARIELPRWVLETPCGHPSAAKPYTQADAAHAALYAQCRLAGDYPYVLARAHELALVSVGERRDLELRIQVALAQAGLSPRPSEKARLKELTGSQRRYPS